MGKQNEGQAPAEPQEENMESSTVDLEEEQGQSEQKPLSISDRFSGLRFGPFNGAWRPPPLKEWLPHTFVVC